MTRKEIKEKIDNNEYHHKFSSCDIEIHPNQIISASSDNINIGLWAENVIVDSSKDETWNRNAVEEHNDEINALNAIYAKDRSRKLFTLKADITECFSKELLDDLPATIRKKNIQSVVDIVIEILEDSVEQVKKHANRKAINLDFNNYISLLYDFFTEKFDEIKKYIILTIKNIK